MKRFLYALTIVASFGLFGQSATAQSTADDRGYIQAFLEDNLSDAGRDIRITGFQGALSSQATMEMLTIADDQGIWLTLKGAQLDWSRRALLSGNLEINELSAKEIILTRLPQGMNNDTPSPEATGFALPDLPVSVNIAKIAIERVEMGVDVFGAAATVKLDGSAALGGSEGRADVNIIRIDQGQGQLRLIGDYSNNSRNLNLSLILAEAENGIIANLMGLPGQPSVDLSVIGSGPFDDFAADIALATDGSPRLGGRVSLKADAVDDGPDAPPPAMNFAANIEGDISPVFLPEYREFFGPDLRLNVNGSRAASGAIDISTLAVTAQSLSIAGNLALDANFWPQEINLSGQIAPQSGGAVMLPLSGAKTTVSKGTIHVAYDANKADTWIANVLLADVTRDGMQFSKAEITASGKLTEGQGVKVGGLNGDVALSINALDLTDPALNRAIGDKIAGKMGVVWHEDNLISLNGINLSGSDYGLTGKMEFNSPGDDFNPIVTGALTLEAEDISRFSDITGVTLSGSSNLAIQGQAGLFSGTFQTKIVGTGQNLGINQPQFDRVFAGPSRLVLSASRGQIGVEIRQFALLTHNARLTGRAAIKTDATEGQFDLSIEDASVLDPAMRGGINLSAFATQNGADWSFATKGHGPGGMKATAAGTVTLDDHRQLMKIAGAADLDADNLAAYASLAGRNLAGAVDMKATGSWNFKTEEFDITADGTAQDLSLGQTEVDKLLRGKSIAELSLSRAKDGAINVSRLDLSSDALSLSSTGEIANNAGSLDFAAKLQNIGLFVEGLSGPLTANGTIAKQNTGWQINTNATGPGGFNTTVTGNINDDFTDLDLAAKGGAPLAIANRFIAPQLASGVANFDLAVNGPPALSSINGTIQTQGAGIAIPALRAALDGINAKITLAGSRAEIAMNSGVNTGGQITLNGPVALDAPYNANLDITLTGVNLSDPLLYETSVSGRITLNGALSGGAKIIGNLELGTVELRVPETGTGTSAGLPGLTHINEPAAVRTTRSRAGLLVTANSQNTPSVAYPLDITLSAPSRIFIRGRGLDAELGGQLRLSGTTAAIVPLGRFELIRGRLDILGKRLTISEGFARLQGSFDPYLRLVAQTEASSTTIRIIVEGVASSPKITFSSSPELPEDEILTRLLFGRDLTKISPLQAIQLAAAVRTLAGKGGLGIVNRMRQRFGFDDLEVSTDADGTAGVRVGKYITENLYSDVTLGSDGKAEVNLNLQITPNLTGKGKLDSKGDTGLGLFFSKDY